MGTEAKQGQRFVVMDGKRFAVEQVQTVRVVDPGSLHECLETAYHICKGEERPVLPTVTKELVDIAAKDCGTYKESAKVLGTSYRSLRHMIHKDGTPQYRRLKGYLGD
jgi:hypothetical protein